MSTEAEPPAERKEPPKVAGEEDVPDAQTPGHHAAPQPPGPPEPKNFRDRTILERLNFGKQLIGWSVFLMVVLSVIGHFYPRDSTLIPNAVEVLKLICTTALGFVFARSPDHAEHDRDE